MNKRLLAAFRNVAALIENESDRRAGTWASGHPYMQEVSKAATGLRLIRDEIERKKK